MSIDHYQHAERLLALARRGGFTLVTAESCTGGLLAAALTDVPGASEVFEYGVVTYANASKQALLGVAAPMLQHDGAVSEPVARAMAEGVCAGAPRRLGIATTGIAGPSGGSKEKPVGLVYIACASSERTDCQKHQFSGNRENIRKQAVAEALKMAEDILLQCTKK